MNKVKEFRFSHKEILGFLNNSVVSQKQAIENLSAARATKIREYTEALIAPSLEHVAEGYLTPGELSYALSAAALLAYIKFFGGKVHQTMPAQDDAESLLGKESA